jgi:transposase-like protein
MQRNRYSKEFKEQALSKARQRGSRTLESVAKELNMSFGSLKGWLKTSNQKSFRFGDLGGPAQRHGCPALETRTTFAGAS